MYVYACVCAHACVFVGVCVCVPVCMSVCVCVIVHVCMSVYSMCGVTEEVTEEEGKELSPIVFLPRY